MSTEKSPYASKNTYEKRFPPKPGRVDLRQDDLDVFIEDQGVRIRVTPSILCPNRDRVDSTNHTLDCCICGGDEVVDLDVHNYSSECWGLFQSIKMERRYDPQGLYDFRDAQLSTPSFIKLGWLYKIELIDFAMGWNQLIKRGERVGKKSKNSDILRYIPAEDSNIPTIVIDDEGRVYKEDDFYLDQETKSIVWKRKRPDTGAIYSLSYPARPTFRVIEMLHENRLYYTDFKKSKKHPIYLPQQALLRWDYLATKSGARLERITKDS